MYNSLHVNTELSSGRKISSIRHRNRNPHAPVKGCGIIKDQILRAGTSIGANIREAQYGYSADDFVFKLQLAMKECAETGYWLDVIEGAGILPPDIVKDLRYKRNRIHRMLVSSLNTKKSNMETN